MTFTCAECGIHACSDGKKENLPKNCPMRDAESMAVIAAEYKKEDIRKFHHTAAVVEAEGYCEWPRLRETMEFARRMGYKKLGIAFCAGFRNEARILSQLLRKNGFEVASVVCKAGGYDKNLVGITDAEKICRGGFEAMCNPIAQAQLLNRCGTDFNIVLGLCVGHDSLFYRYADAMTTTLVAKDRALAHNPVGAIYMSDGYMKKKVNLEQE